jgi:hypothetical protein
MSDAADGTGIHDLDLVPGPDEPPAGPWRDSSPADLLRDLVGDAGPARRRVLAVDGRSGSGKTTLARRLLAAHPAAALVSTDDLAWHHSLFDWGGLAMDGVLLPFRRGGDVRFRPPAWDERARPGAVTVPASAWLLVLEGVGASQLALTGQVDAAVWVQSDFATAARLGIARDIASGVNGDAALAAEFWRRWEVAEVGFLRTDRPWERADVVVAGTGSPAAAGLLVADAPRARPGA